MASPLSIAPSGIGSGEAQIVRTPLTERAILTEYQNNLKRNQEEKLKEAEDIAKMNVEGTHRGDAKQLMEAYNGVIDAYAKYSSSKNRAERAAAKIAYEEAKADFNFKQANSKDYNKQLYDIGQAMLGAGAEDYTPEQKAYYNKLKTASSFDTQIDLEQFNKKPKPLDVIDINQKIVKASTMPKSTTFGQGNIAGKDVIITSSGESLSKPLFFDNLSAVIQQQPRYAQEVLIPKYKDAYIKQGGDIKDTDKFTQFIFENEFENQRPAVDVTKKSASQIGENWGNTMNFGGGGNKFKDPNTGEMVAGNVSISKSNPNSTENYVVPMRNVIPFNLDFTADFSNGVYSVSDGLDKVKLKETPQVKASAIVELPYETLKNGDEKLLASKGEAITKVGNSESKKSIQSRLGSNAKYKKYIQVTTSNDDIYFIPLENVPIDKFVRADDPVLKAIKSWGGSTKPASTKDNTQVTDVSATFKKK